MGREERWGRASVSARISRAKNKPEAGLGPTAASVPQMSLNIYPELTASKRANETRLDTGGGGGGGCDEGLILP